MSDSLQANLFESDAQAGPVECLGLTFENDEVRLSHFLAILREKLKDPEFRKIEGFPIGEDEDILALSDPPYYTACPNPFLEDFIRCYGKPYIPETDTYSRKPLTSDISATRDTAIYSAHTYHTKVPPEAIYKYISNFTDPGDLVLDAFAGSGMTGVACGLGGELNFRKVILCDLSPIAAFISENYINPPNALEFDIASQSLLDTCEEFTADLWNIESDNTKASIEFQIWTEIFICPVCQASIEPTEVVNATNEIGTAKEFPCPKCSALVSKAPTKKSRSYRLERHLKSYFDPALNKSEKCIARAPVLTQIQDSSGRRKYITSLEAREKLEKLTLDSEYWYPTNPLLEGERYRLKDCLPSYGIKNIHHFYSPRQLKTFSCLWHFADQERKFKVRKSLKFFLSSNSLGLTLLNRYGPTHYSQVNKYFSGTLYIPSTIAETSPSYTYRNKRNRLIKAFKGLQGKTADKYVISTQSSTNLTSVSDNSIDYVFIDPPFGKNLQYSELNQIWESWLKVRTDPLFEAVVDPTRKRDVFEYKKLMQLVFNELYRTLKPGRWMTVAFHNSSNAVWMSIQEALSFVGFTVADVRTLDKERQTYKQIRQGTVKQDLVISAYKPTHILEKKFSLEAGTEKGVWNFVFAHLGQLPEFVISDQRAETVVERQNYMLFDRMVAFHIQRGISVPLSASEFYAGLDQRFPKRDGMYFLPDQIAEYDRKRMTVKEMLQLDLFVNDESTAVQWLRQQLTKKPQTFQELHPGFLKAIGGWAKHETTLELSDLLADNFLRYDGGTIPKQVVSWLAKSSVHRAGIAKVLGQEPGVRSQESGDDDGQTAKLLDLVPDTGLETRDAGLLAAAKDRWYIPDPNKAGDLEKLRDKALLKEFEEYRTTTKKLKVFRMEAMRAGFKHYFQQRDYKTIIEVARKVPDTILQEDSKLLMFYDNAVTRAGEE